MFGAEAPATAEPQQGRMRSATDRLVQELLGDLEADERDSQRSKHHNGDSVDAADPAHLHQHAQEAQTMAQAYPRDAYS